MDKVTMEELLAVNDWVLQDTTKIEPMFEKDVLEYEHNVTANNFIKDIMGDAPPYLWRPYANTLILGSMARGMEIMRRRQQNKGE